MAFTSTSDYRPESLWGPEDVAAAGKAFHWVAFRFTAEGKIKCRYIMWFISAHNIPWSPLCVQCIWCHLKTKYPPLSANRSFTKLFWWCVWLGHLYKLYITGKVCYDSLLMDSCAKPRRLFQCRERSVWRKMARGLWQTSGTGRIYMWANSRCILRVVK